MSDWKVDHDGDSGPIIDMGVGVGGNRVMFTVQAVGSPFLTDDAEALSATIVRSVNAHDAMVAALRVADEYILQHGVEEDGACYVCESLKDREHEDNCPLVGARNREWQRWYANQSKAEACRD